jgi:hypothetical protein
MNKSEFEAISSHAVTVAGFEFKTGIFPSEMAFVLTAIEKSDCDFVIDSGRGPDAFSLLCLQGYQKNTIKRPKLFSLDTDSVDDKHFFRDFSDNPDIVLKVGNSFDDIPDLYRENKEGVWAVIIDGPKHEDQILLSLLVIKHMRPRILALRNSPPGSLQQRILDPDHTGRYYEQYAFKENEFIQLLTLNVEQSRRTLEQSSLLLFSNPTLPSRIPHGLWIQFRVCSFFWTLKITISGFTLVYKWIARPARLILWKMPFVKSRVRTIFRRLRKSFILMLYPIYIKFKRAIEK